MPVLSLRIIDLLKQLNKEIEKELVKKRAEIVGTKRPARKSATRTRRARQTKA